MTPQNCGSKYDTYLALLNFETWSCNGAPYTTFQIWGSRLRAVQLQNSPTSNRYEDLLQSKTNHLVAIAETRQMGHGSPEMTVKCNDAEFCTESKKISFVYCALKPLHKILCVYDVWCCNPIQVAHPGVLDCTCDCKRTKQRRWACSSVHTQWPI